jgi:hypothetical protein
MGTKLKTRILGIAVAFALSACAAMEESMTDVSMTFKSKEDRISYWKEECQRMGATDAQLFDCALRQEESYQRRLNE